MATYTELQTRIASELSRDDLTTSIQEAILSAIRHYQRKLVLFNQSSQSISTVASTASYGLTSDFLAFERVEITIDGDIQTLEEVSFNEIATIDISGHTGQPSKYAYRDYELRLYPVPDDVYTVTVYYWSQVAAPSTGSDSTDWTNDALDLIRHRAKCDLASNKIKDFAAAQTFKTWEDETYGGMVIQRDRVFSNGRVIPTQF